MKKFILAWGILSITLVALILFKSPSTSSEHETVKVTVNNSVFKALVSDTPALRTQGLSGKKDLASNEVMLFVFETSGFYGFWMKDMLFAIDIVWLSDDLKVVDIKKDVKPETYPEVFNPKQTSKYVLEFPSGTVEHISLKEGDQVIISEKK